MLWDSPAIHPLYHRKEPRRSFNATPAQPDHSLPDIDFLLLVGWCPMKGWTPTYFGGSEVGFVVLFFMKSEVKAGILKTPADPVIRT